MLAPLSRRAKDLDAPLHNGWQRLSAALEQTNVTAIDFLHITNQLAETRQAIALLENGKQKAAARLELSSSVRSNMSAPFQLVVYQDERSQQMDDLARLAAIAGQAGFTTSRLDEHLEIDAPRAFAGELNRQAMAAGITLVELGQMRANLEEIFLDITEGEAQ